MDEIAHTMRCFIFCASKATYKTQTILETVYTWFHPHETSFFSHLINSVPCHLNCLHGSSFIVHETAIENGLSGHAGLTTDTHACKHALKKQLWYTSSIAHYKYKVL
jgi:hypothetical protein